MISIAKKVGVSEMTLARWRKDHTFVALVQQYQAEWREKVRREGIADRLRRVEGQVRRHRKLERVIEARAEAASKDKRAAPGAETGLLVRGRVDDVLLKELRAHEEAVAVELGQRVTRVETTHRDLREEELVALLEMQLSQLPGAQRAEIEGQLIDVSPADVSAADSPAPYTPDQGVPHTVDKI